MYVLINNFFFFFLACLNLYSGYQKLKSACPKATRNVEILQALHTCIIKKPILKLESMCPFRHKTTEERVITDATCKL